MTSLGRAVAAIALLGATAAWGQQPTSDSPTVSAGWQRLDAASSVGGTCYVVRNRAVATKETASWALQAPTAGNYQIQVYIPPVDQMGPRTHNATYVINRGRGLVVHGGVDQSLSGWQSIGTYALARGTIGVILTDRTQEADGSHAVVADAVRLLAADQAPGYNATLGTANLAPSAAAGDVVTFDVRLTNTGSQTWYRDPAATGQIPVRLALVQAPAPLAGGSPVWDPGYGWLPRSRERVVMDTAQVAPGQTGSFLFTVQLGQNIAPGVYGFQFRPVAEPSGAPGGGVIATDVVLNINVAARLQSDLDFSALQLYRANTSVHTSNSDGDKLLGRYLPDDRSPTGALAYAKGRGTLNVLGLTDHGEELNATEWNGQTDAIAAQDATTAGSPFFVGLRGFKWTKTTGPHDFFGFPWEGSPSDDGHLSIFGTSTWTGTRAAQDGAPPQLTPNFVAPPAPAATLAGQPTSLADWLWVNGYPRPNALDNGVSPAQFAAPALFFRSNFFMEFLYQADMDRFFPLMAVGTGETQVTSDYVRVPNVASEISDKGGYRFLGPDTPADVTNKPPAEILAAPADVLAQLGHPEDQSKWGTNPNNRNRYWFETALSKGWHVAPTLPGDNHAGCYCDDQGYTGIWAKSVAGQNPAQAQATVLQALRERAVFASEDRGLSAQFSVFSSGVQYRMGQRNVPLSNALRFRLDLSSVAVGGNPADVAVADAFIVSSEGTVRIGGPLTGPTARIETTLPLNLSGTAHERWFYALVVQSDGNRLLTAPVWTVPSCPPPTCSLWPQEGKVPAGACSILGFTSQNGVSATLSIDGGTAFPVPLSGTHTVLQSELNPNTKLHQATFRVVGLCDTTVCTVILPCNSILGGQFCQISVFPKTGDCTTLFTATWNSSGLLSPRLVVDGVDQGAVPDSGSRTLAAPGNGTHIVQLVSASLGQTTAQAPGCQDTFTVSGTADFPMCKMSVSPSASGLGTTFDICFFVSNASRADVFVDGVLKCTELNPESGIQHNCRFLGSTVGAGLHTASLIVTGCGGTCQRALPFLVEDVGGTTQK